MPFSDPCEGLRGGSLVYECKVQVGFMSLGFFVGFWVLGIGFRVYVGFWV